MKQWLQRFAVMSAALVLLCVTAFSQKENDAKSVTNSYSQVIINPSNNVNLNAGNTTSLEIVPKPGYYNPSILYNNVTYSINQQIIGRIFTATLTYTGNKYILYITVNRGVPIGSKEYMSAKADIKPENTSSKSAVAQSNDATITITVVP